MFMDLINQNPTKNQLNFENESFFDGKIVKIEEQIFAQNYCEKQSAYDEAQNDPKRIKFNGQSFKSQWTRQEQMKLYRLHDRLGNKWGSISQELPGKTDNSVKNYFYSKLRKGLRRLNKVIHEHFKKQLTQIKMIVLYKIIEATEQKHKDIPFCDFNISELCTELKNRILSYSDDENEFSDYQKYPQIGYELINDLISFSKRYKRKAKKSRKSSMQEQPIMLSGKKQSSKNTNSEFDDSENNSVQAALNSQPSSLNSYEEPQYFLDFQQDKTIRSRVLSNQNIIMNQEDDVFSVQDAVSQKMQTEEIEQTLKESGIFSDDFMPPLFGIYKRPSLISFRMDGSGQASDYQYFEESAIQMRFLPMKTEEDQLRHNMFLL